MKKTILVAGATGNLGSMICMALVKRGAVVKALVRPESDAEKIALLVKNGIEPITAQYSDHTSLANACEGVDCVVSALAGLEEVIVDHQSALLDAALKCGVKRFIPSDFCTDYNPLVQGENRNFDLRRKFKAYIDGTTIQATSIFNGAFADILKYNTPMLDLKNKTIGYWGEKADWKLDFTTMENTADFTAEAALKDETPRNLHIASFQVSPNMLAQIVNSINNEHFTVHKISDLDQFANFIKQQRADNPAGEMELYAKWQQAQYMYSMFTTQHPTLDNEIFGQTAWTTAADYLSLFIKKAN
ncbi:NmrA family protein [Pedobacter sp. Leaf216]|uniref:NmrA family NAD(P)-binding protein n=1 Tax=Pedobacter sp. Leaf216 TaxID=1735684 RepID=UPI0006F75C71|nr:NmrA family NAD(P)-binding protein [Pedobacter sp. Leaf216]KQM73033.1 NmrA family protein [Pedobacter sp. Leaf216]